MEIKINVNGEDLCFENVSPNENVISILRGKLNLCESKNQCGQGKCGSCAILLDDKPVLSCLLPIYTVADCNIITMEYFKGTDEYKDIYNAFEGTALNTCGFCTNLKIFSINEFLEKRPRPTKEEIESFIELDTCRCVDKTTYFNAILLAATLRRKRINEQ